MTYDEIKGRVKSGYYDFSAIKYSLEDKIGFDTFQNDLSSVGKTIEDSYKGWQSTDALSSNRSSIEAMQDRVSAYKEYQRLFGSKDAAKEIDKLQSSLRGSLDDWDDLSTKYSKYKNADAYKKENDELTKLYSMDSEQLKGKKGVAYTTADGYNIKWEDLYNDAVTKEYEADIDKAIDVNKHGEYKKKDVEYKYGFGSSIPVISDENAYLYNYINNDRDARGVGTIYNTAMSGTYDFLKNAHYTTEEKMRINAIWETKGAEEALKYAELLSPELRKRRIEYQKQQNEAMAKESPVGASIISVIANLGNNAMALPLMAADYVDNGEIDPDDALYTNRRAVQTIRSTVENDVIDSGTGKFLYRHGMNFADNLVARAVSLGMGTGLASQFLMSSGAAVDTVIDAKERGLSDGQALSLGAISGAAEAFFESKGFEAWVDKKTLTKNALEYFANGIKTELIGEVLTEGANDIADIFIAQDVNKLNTEYQSHLASGLSEKEAFLKVVGGVASRYADVVAGTILTAGAMTGPSATIGGIQQHSYNKAMGKNIKANERVGDVFDLANNPEIASAYETYTRYANKGITADNVSDAQLGRVYSMAKMDAQAVMDSKTSTEEQRDAAQKTLDNLGVYSQANMQSRTGSVQNIDKKAFKDYSEKNIEVEDAEGNTKMVSALDILIEDGLESAEGTDAYRIATELKAKIDNGKKVSAKEIQSLTEANDRAIRAEESSGIATQLIEKGESEEIANLVARKMRGEALTTEEAEKVLESENALQIIAEIDNADNTTTEILETAKGMDKEKGALLVSLYDGKTEVESYTNAFNLAVAKAENNFGIRELLAHKGVLSNEQIGKIYSEVVSKADQNTRLKFQKLSEKTANLKAYKGIIKDSVIDYNNTSAEGKVNWNSLTDRQRKAVTFIKGFAQATGINLTFVANDTKHNGQYDRTTNTITINLDEDGFDAINKIQESIIPTMSHELTHWMEMKSPVLFKKICDIVFPTLERVDGLTESERIAKEIRKRLKKEYKGKPIPSEVLKEALNDSNRIKVARSEIVARACEDMLSRSKVGREMFNSLTEKEQKTLIDKIKDIIEDIKNWINNALGLYESTSYEAQIMRVFDAEMDKLSALWDEMLKESVEVNQALEKSGAFEHNNELANVGLNFDAESNSIAPTTLLSEKTWTESEYVQNRDVAISAIVKALGVTKEEATRYVDNINSISRLIADDRARLDYDPNIDGTASALKTNKEYKWTVDMSTLCAKRLLFTGTFDAIQKKLPNTVFDSDDIVSLRSMMMQRGYEVACGICYVESTRRELGPITAEFIERYKLAQKNGTPISKINSAGEEVTLQEKGTKRNFYAEDGYVPTLAELNTTDIDLVKRDHPEVYAAYLAFMKSRGQAIPKLLETRTEYKGEILKHFNSKSAVKSRNDAGGLRVQSFSDFEVAHLIDMMQIVLDMSRVGLMSQAYTKVPAFADVFGNTGMKINLSLIAKDSGLDKNGNLIFDDVEGMPHKEAFRLRNKYSKNVGTILVGKNDAHIRAALADSRIDYVIPFHKSFWKESLYDALGLTGYDDYTDTQNEKPFDKDRKIKNFQPSEYWDYSKSGEENAKTYLKMCAEDGRIPKFPQFQNCEGYWKLLIDFKMYDNDGVGSPQLTVKPDFSMDEANAIMNNYEGGHRAFPVAQDVVDDFVKKYEGRKDILYSEKVTEITEDEYKEMKKHFGVTGNFNVAGYMLKNGSLLDFSGKHWGDTTSRSRQVDHREISEVLPSENNGVDAMVNMISNGNIRLMPEVGGINLAVAPSKNQRVLLRRYIEYMSPKEGIIVDIDMVGGDTIKSFTYNPGTSANTVMRDIDNYFKGGTQSELMRFHTAEGDGILYSDKEGEIKKAEELTEADLRDLLEKVQNGEIEDSSYIPMRASTPEFFIDVVYEHSQGEFNVMHVPMAAQVEHVKQNMEEEEDGISYGEARPHNLSVDDVVTISKEMGHPAYIVLQNNGRYAMVVSFYNKNRKKVVVSIDFASDDKDKPKNYKYQRYINGYNDGYYNIIVTQFEPDDLSSYLKNNEVVYDKKKMNGRYQVGSGRIVTFTHDTPFIEDIVSQEDSKSQENPSKTDSEGNTLTKEQIEYFKDSKVRDADGNLLVVYHGTPSGGFTEFKLPHYLSTLTSAQGAGYYFTDKANAKQYTKALNGKHAGKKQVYQTYLNITNPIEITQYSKGKISDDAFRRIMERGNYEWGKEHTDIEKRLQFSLTDADRLMEMVRVFNGDEILSVMKDELGYDGVRFTDKYGDIWVSWSKEQIKDINNTNPTSNPDIMYSLKDEINSLPAEDKEIVLEVRRRAIYSRSIATMSEDRLSKAYDDYSHSTPSTTNGYLAYIEPYDFIYLTTTNTEAFLENNTQRLNEGVSEQWGNENNIQKSGPLYLSINEDGKVIGHEGRHRMAGLLREGVDRVAVVIKTGRVDNAKPISIKKLLGQDFTETRNYKSIYVHDMLPISKEYENINRHIFGDVTEGNLFVETNIRYSEKEQGVYDIVGETERIRKENEKLDADAINLKNIIGTEEIENRRYLALANYLKKISGSTMDSAKLGNMLKKAYTSMQNANVLNWNDIASQTQAIAESLMNKDLGVSTDYFLNVMHEIRKDKISLSEEQRAMVEKRFGNYGNFHKYVFGRANVTKDGKPLSDVWKNWAKIYPSLFDKNLQGAEQIDALIELVDALKSTSSIMGEYERQEAIRHLSTEIYNQFWNIAADSSTLEEAKTYRAEHKAMMTELRKDYEQRQKSLATHPTGETALKYESLLKKVRETKKKEIALAKQHGREMMDKYKENAERKTRIQSITSNSLNLNELLMKNSKDKHIPEIMKEPVTALLQAIDFSSKRMLEKGEPTQKDISLSKALGKVKDMMVKATNAHDELVELYGHGLDDDIEMMVDHVDDIMRMVGDNEFVLNRMSLADLQTLDKMVKTIRHAVNKLNKFHIVNHAKGIANLSQESVVYLDSLGKANVHDGFIGKAEKMLNWGNALPYYAFKRYGSGGMKVYEALQDGWDKFAFNTKQILDYANESYTSEEVKEWGKEIKTFKILIPATELELADGNYTPQYQEVQLTVPQIMSMYCLNKREQARGHLFKGGIRVADFKTEKGKVVSQTDGIIFTEADVSKILNSLTSRQIEVANKLQRFMNTVSTDWGNEVSMARFGYKAFGEENYFPIQSDKNNLAVNDETEQINSLFKLLNMSFTKNTVEKANNRIVISDIFDVFAQHTSDMAKYNALALPVLDAFKWYNYTEKTEKGEGTFRTSGVKQSIEKAFGKDGQSYFTTFLKDINGQQDVSRDTLGKSFFTNAKIAAVGLNLRVVLLQPTSYARAGAVIDNKYLLKALSHKPKVNKAEEHCGIALWKSMGYYDTNIQRGVEEQIKHADTWKDKATEWSMKGAEVADKLTWGYLWNACELEIRDTRKDLKVGSKEFYEAISKRLREVIYATQVVDSTMTRSQMMRSTDWRDKMLTSFASEPTLSYNMLQDAYMEYSLDARQMGKSKAIKKNASRIARVISAYTITNAVAALVESAFDAIREDDDEEMDMIAFMKLYLKNFAFDMSIGNKIPYVKELYSLMQGYSSSRLDTQWAQYLYSAINAKKPSKRIKDSIRLISQLSGIPFYNVYRDTMAALNKLDLFTEEDLNEMFGDFDD